MSANNPARLQPARRTILTSALAGLAVGGTAYTAQAVTASPDPIFALLEAERAAYARLDEACRACDAAEELAHELAGSRLELIVGDGITVQDCPDDPGQPASRSATPLVVRHWSDLSGIYGDRKPTVCVFNGIRSRLFNELTMPEADARAAVEAWEGRQTEAYERAGVAAAEAAKEEADDAHDLATDTLLDTVPTTAAGLVALAALVQVRTEAGHPADRYLPGLLAAVRGFHAREA